MERSEPTFVPEWLKSTTSHHQFQTSSFDEQAVSKATRNKSHVNTTDNDTGLGRPSSSYFRRSSSSNGSTHLRSYSSFGNGRYSDKEKSESKHRSDYSDPLSNILPSRFEKDGLRRSHSSLSAKQSGKPVAASNAGGVKIVFERDFPSLGAEDKQTDSGLSSAIQSLRIGNAAVIGGDGWTSALAEVPVMAGGNGSNVQSSTNMGTGRNMAETLVQGPPRPQTDPQVSTGTQRLEELAVKQSRQLIPMTPSMPKVLALNSSDKPKPKVAQSRPVSTKFDSSKPSSPVGKLHVLKPSRERNLSPTGGNLPTSPLSVPSAVPVTVAERKPSVATLEKRPSSQAQSRSDFFNLMRKKSLTSVTPDNTGSPVSAIDDKPDETGTGNGSVATVNKGGTQRSSESTVCNGDADVATERSTCISNNNNGILYSEEEEARFLRSMGWEETGEEEEGLTEEEISAFVSKYLNLQAASKIFKGAQPKLLMTQMGKNGGISSESRMES